MSKRISPLDHVRVAAPCSVGWDNMIGDERVRFCGQCNLNVYNLSGMTKRDAEHLIAQAEGRLCIRYYRRADGTILTKNCPVGLRALKRRVSRIAQASITAVLSFLAGFVDVSLRFVKADLRSEDSRIMLSCAFDPARNAIFAAVVGGHNSLR